MLPHFSHNDYVITSRFFLRSLNVGDVVVATHAQYGELIKRVSSIDESTRRITLSSDHPSGLSSDKMGVFFPQHVLGKVIFHIRQ